MNALVDSLNKDDHDNGGVEEALRRLEGQINPQRRKEKANVSLFVSLLWC